MYTFEELDGKHYTGIQFIAEDLGIEYTTKAETIEAILAKQNEATEPVIELPVTPEPEPVQPEPAATSWWAKQGYAVGNDGYKVRYGLSGKRLN